MRTPAFGGKGEKAETRQMIRRSMMTRSEALDDVDFENEKVRLPDTNEQVREE